MNNEIKLLTFPRHGDHRGALIPVNALADVPFPIERIFYIKDLNDEPRGFHSHRKCLQTLVPIVGGVTVTLERHGETTVHRLEKDNEGLFVPLNTWLKMTDFTEGCVVLVLCSYRYDEAEYVRDYDRFLELEREDVATAAEQLIKCFDLSAQTKSLQAELRPVIQDVIDRGAFVLGPELQAFECDFADLVGSKWCVGVSNGTSALVCAIKALNLPPNSTIAVQTNTYIAAPLAIEMCGHSILLIDVDNEFCLKMQRLRDLMPHIQALVLVHLYGRSCCHDLDAVVRLASEHGVKVIEDAAQAHGSTWKGRALGTFGDIGTFSFYPSKNLGAFGEAGCIVTNNDQYAKFAKRYRNYGCDGKYDWQLKGANERMHNLQAAVLSVKLRHLKGWNFSRNHLADRYREGLRGLKRVRVPPSQSDGYCNYHLFVVLVLERDDLQAFLKENRIDSAIHYPHTFYQSPAFVGDFSTQRHHYNADWLCGRLLSLPMYPEMPVEHVDRVCKVIREWNAKKA